MNGEERRAAKCPRRPPNSTLASQLVQEVTAPHDSQHNHQPIDSVSVLPDVTVAEYSLPRCNA
jgi:hypothetical protein